MNQHFDRIHGTDTAGTVLLAAAGMDDVDAQRGNLVYRPLWESSFHATMSRFSFILATHVTRYTFVDIGSGKGKLLLLASLYPFKKIIGVEFASALNQIAISNIAKFTHSKQSCGNIASVHGDATTFELPPGPILAMMFNSLDLATTAELVASFVAQRSATSEPVFLVYENVRRASEIGTAIDVPHSWETLEITRHRIIVGNSAAASTWRSRDDKPATSAPLERN